MNCKPGDLAIVVRTGRYTKQAAGRIVRILSRARDVKPLGDDYSVCAVWHYEPVFVDDLGNRILLMNDCCVRPIRPDGITDADVQQLYQPGPRIKQPESAQ